MTPARKPRMTCDTASVMRSISKAIGGRWWSDEVEDAVAYIEHLGREHRVRCSRCGEGE